MDKAAVLDRLRASEAELRALGVARLSLFGSVARDEARADSDVDLAASFAAEANVGLFRYAVIEQRLADLLGVKVDLITDPPVKPRMKNALERDRVHVF